MAEHPGIPPAPEYDGDRERLRLAEEVMTQLLPRFTDIARSAAGVTGLRVVAATGAPTAMTDGSTVIVPVDPEMAAVNPRNPCRCDHDNAECAYHRTVGLLLHEAAHISEGSTRRPDSEFADKFLGRVNGLLQELPWPERKLFEDTHGHKLRVLGRDPYDSALELCAKFNADAPLMANAFEDARINLAVGDRRSALGQQMRRLVEDFVMRFDGSFTDNPVGQQVGATIEVELEHGMDLKPLMNSKTGLNVLNDEFVQHIIESPMGCTAEACANAVVLCEYSREKYGLFEPNPEEGRTGGTTTTGNDTDSEGRMRPGQQRREHAQTRYDNREARERARRNAGADRTGYTDPPPDSEYQRGDLTEARNEALEGLRETEVSDNLDDTMQQPSAGGFIATSGDGNYRPVILRPGFKHDVNMYGSGQAIYTGFLYPAGGEWPHNRRVVMESEVHNRVQGSKRMIADALGMNRRSASTPNLLRGRLHGSKLARVPTGNRRAFRRIDKPRKRSYAVLIGVDLSGSTDGAMCEFLKSMAYAQATLLDSIGVPFAVCGHTGGAYTAADSPDDLSLDGPQESLTTIRVAKNFAEQWDQASQTAVGAFIAGHCNIDGVTMRTYIDMLCTQRATDRILLYYTDGSMPAEDHANQTLILKAQCRRAAGMAQLPDRRLHVIGVAANNSEPKNYGLDTIEVDAESPDESVRTVVQGLAERIAQTIK